LDEIAEFTEGDVEYNFQLRLWFILNIEFWMERIVF